MKKRSVLFVDNDRLLLEALGEFLEGQGYRVRRATDGLEALEAVREEAPDFILLDLIMPKIDGGRLCRYLREDPRFQRIPIVVFSGLAARDIARMADVAADAYVAKGPLQTVAKNILAAIHKLEANGRSASFQEAILGYEGFRSRRLVGELLSLKRHYELLLETMSEGVLEVDEEGRIFYANAMALALLGKGEQALIGSKVWEAFEPSYREEVKRIAAGLRDPSKPTKQEVILGLRETSFRATFARLSGGAPSEELSPPYQQGEEVYGGLLVLLEDIGYVRRLS